MVRITLVPHQAHNTMASLASLFMILAVTIHIQAARLTYDVPDMFPQTKTAEAQHQLPNLEDIMNGFDELCPPLGLPTERFNVRVMGTHSPPVGGCASMQTVRHDVIPAFNLWLGNVQNGGGSCDETDMDHYMFECLSKHAFLEDNNIKGWFVTLYDRTAKWTGQKDYKCGLYSMILDDPPTIKMIISANRTCEGLSQIMENDVHTVSEGMRHFHDGSVALLLTKDWPHPISSSDVWRKKRSALKDNVYRFPDWSQGSWLDLQIDGSLIRYDTAFHEKDDVDYEQDSDYGKEEDADISGSELYMQRSQRYNPVGISGRNRRSISNMNTVKMLKNWITTIQNNTLLDKLWLKHQLNDLLNDMRNLDLFNFLRENSTALSEKQKYFLNLFTEFLPESVINDLRNTLKVNKRMRRSSTQHSQQQRASTKFTWRCIMPVDNDEKQHNSHEVGAKFLIYGGRIMEKTAENDNHQYNEPKSDTLFDIKEDSKMSYGCLWLAPRGPNIIEFSIIGTGLPDKHQDIKSFARQLCTENKAVDKDSNMRNMKKLHPRRHSWITETRADEGKRVAVGCPIHPGTVFYGEIPAPPPPSIITNNSQTAPPRLCVRLISSADDCTNGQAGPIDQMKYTVSECVVRDSSTGTSPQIVATGHTIFEEREYKCLGQWTEPQQHINQEPPQKPIMLTYMYVKRLNPTNNGTDQFECFVGTIIPNDEGASSETTTTLLLTEAGSRTLCSRRSDPYQSGMKLVGTKINKEGACKGSDQPAQVTAGGSWYPLKPQPISPSVPAAESSGGTWYAAPPVPVIAQSPTTMKPPILTGRHTGGNGALFTSRQNERRPPPKTNNSIRPVFDKRIIIVLSFILFTDILYYYLN